MTRVPQVSVVMSVFNGERVLSDTLESVLNQRDCDLELVVVNDGSTDGSGALLDAFARRDPRVRVLHQANTGLTGALIRGCAQARGEFIARHDADDHSLPNRMKEQAAFLLAHPEAVVVASGVRFLAPGGEWLFDYEPPDRVDIPLDPATFRVPPLCGSLFRRDAYVSAGGFRKEFTVAQDADLWLRLAELGECRGLPAVHYQGTITLGGISSRFRGEQVALTTLAIACARERRAGRGDQHLLDRHISPAATAATMGRLERARFHYFIGSCLRKNDRAAARRYFQRAIQDNPLHAKAVLRWLTD